MKRTAVLVYAERFRKMLKRAFSRATETSVPLVTRSYSTATPVPTLGPKTQD